MTCHAWHEWQGKKWRGRDFGKKRKKESKRERNWNVNKSYRNVNWKMAKSANRHDKRQFTHRSMQLHYYIYIFIYFYIYYYRLTKFNRLSAVFRPPFCYFAQLPVNCCANVTALYGHGEVMCRTLTKLTELFLPFFKCKQIRTL